MPKSISDLRRKRRQSSKSPKTRRQIESEWYQSKEWRTVREESRREQRQKDEDRIISVFEELENATSSDLYEFLTHKKQYPLCNHCLEEGFITVGNVCDHIIPIKRGGAKLDKSNLQWLCHDCHAIKSGKEAH